MNRNSRSIMKRTRISAIFLAAGLAWSLQPLVAADLRVGIIGCDTSHAIAFTDVFNTATNKFHVPGAKVVAAFKGGSPDLPESISHVEEYSRVLREKYQVTFYDTIEALCTNIDVVLLESVDGRRHLEQIKPVLAARRPVFVDKPIAANLADALEIFRLAQAAQVPMWSASSLRYGKDTQAVRQGSIGRVTYAETYSPVEFEEHHTELYWYGIHGVESLFTAMGTGCESVRYGSWTNGVEVTAKWSSGRSGMFRQEKAKVYSQNFHGVAKGEKGEAKIGSFDGYGPLVVEIMTFFKTGKAPVAPEETLEIAAFMTAAAESKARGGAEVELAEVMKKAGMPPQK